MSLSVIPPNSTPLTLDQRVELGAVDGIYFGHEWFPRSMRQSSPEFHYSMMNDIESQENQFVAWEVFRGGAKTTLLRIATAKRVSYGLSRVAVFTSAAQRHAERTVRWLKRQVEVNRYWTETFGLQKGSKWSDAEIEIINTILGTSVFVLAIGMTGQTRGINLDDYRPDFWMADDPCNEENTGSEDQRKKTTDLFFGAMQGSMAPRSENPHSKMGLAQTSLHKEDLINSCHSYKDWKTTKFGMIDQYGKSVWPDRWSDEEVKQKKSDYISKGQKHIWDREYECKITPREGKAFMMENLQFWDTLPTDMVTFMGIDPAREKHANPKKAHKSALVTIGVSRSGLYLLDYYAQKQKNPLELWAEFYRMQTRWNVRLTGVEGIAFQQMLAWYFRQQMIAINYFPVIREIEDRRRKADRIRQAYAGPIQERRFFVGRGHTDFISELDDYSDEVDIDVLDAGAMAITLSSPTLLMLAQAVITEGDDEMDYKVLIETQESQYPDLPTGLGHCP